MFDNFKAYPKNKFQKPKGLPSKDLPIWARLLSGLKKENAVKKIKGAKNKEVATTSIEVSRKFKKIENSQKISHLFY